ncbi:nucleolar protein [Monosporozyma unispora]|nr:nucleolar protein [Kazachstania unispora]
MAKSATAIKKNTKPSVSKEQEKIDETVQVENNSSSSEDEMEGLSDLEEESNKKQHTIKKLDSKKKKQQQLENESKKNKNGNDEYSPIIYVSRLPHGFHEKELSKYFSQFGDLKEVRLARNKKTGNSRHYGFIEFANKDDAKIAQETMNNYLLMGHLLQVRLMGKGAKIEKLFKYKKRVFNEAEFKKNSKEIEDAAAIRHEERMTKLKDAGIDFKW